MDPQNSNSYIESPKAEVKNKRSSENLTPVISVTFFILISLGVIIFLYSQNQNLKEKLATYEVSLVPVATTTPLPTANPDMPIISTPSAGSIIKSPLKITGAVPAGWMNEGVFPITLVDANKKVITQTQATETVPGSWQSGKPIEFTATLTFKAATGSGVLVLENDNPNGSSESAKVFEIPVDF